VRLKLDENLPADLTDELTRRGHDVVTVLDERLGGRNDRVVVRAAIDENRMVITLDRGVGDIRNFPPGSHAGIVVLRPVSQDPASTRDLVSRLVRAHDLAALSRCVVVVEPNHVRVRRPEDPNPQ
jgi:predicted nuclease of predicted toxin-antitoxin system